MADPADLPVAALPHIDEEDIAQINAVFLAAEDVSNTSGVALVRGGCRAAVCLFAPHALTVIPCATIFRKRSLPAYALCFDFGYFLCSSFVPDVLLGHSARAW